MSIVSRMSLWPMRTCAVLMLTPLLQRCVQNVYRRAWMSTPTALTSACARSVFKSRRMFRMSRRVPLPLTKTGAVSVGLGWVYVPKEPFLEDCKFDPLADALPRCRLSSASTKS